MGPFDLVRHPLVFTGITLPEFLRWYVFTVPSKILRSYMAYLRAFVEIFSFAFLAKTLFAPWRQITDSYNQKGFNLNQFMQSLTLNLVSRVIGFLFRSITLFLGFGFISALTILFAVYYMLWLSFPVVFWVGITYLLTAFA